MHSSSSRKFDVAVIGGGVIGSSVAYFLLREAPGLAVCVIDTDPYREEGIL